MTSRDGAPTSQRTGAAGTTPAWLGDVARAIIAPGKISSIPSSLPDDAVAAWATLEQHAGVHRDALIAAIAARFQCAVADLSAVDPAAVRLVPERLARRYNVIPVTGDQRTIFVATSSPGDLDLERDLAFATGRAVELAVADPAVIRALLDDEYAPERAAEAVAERLQGDDEGASFLDEDLQGTPPGHGSDADPTGVVRRIAATLLGDAVAQGVSDIHLARIGASGVVRYRIDGIMQEVLTMPSRVYGRVISRLKVIGKLDISDHLRPQDGRARIVVGGRGIDLRLSTVPVQGGDERMVIRLLSDDVIQSLDAMDMVDPERAQLRGLLANADGLVLLTGPTGSGKTTTLHAALKQRLSADVTIMTVENPVEYKIAGVSQVQVEPKQGLTFATVLRALLRQDPDIVLVGEIRDAETAETAAQAAMTGHLVLSTVHADDAPNALLRLRDLGLDAATLGEAFRGAAAQRLLRRLCPACKVSLDPGAIPAEEAAFIAATGGTPGARAVGCAACRFTGYKGRLPIHQVFVVTPHLRNLIRSGAELTALRAAAVAEGMRTLGASAATRIIAGDTTVAEAVRVLGQRFWEEISNDEAAPPTAAPVHDVDAGEWERAEEPTRAPARPTLSLATAASLSDVAELLLEPSPEDREIIAAEPAALSEPSKKGDPPQASVAVVPFSNLSANPDGEGTAFVDGITEDLMVALTKVPGLRVAARTSSFVFKDRGDDLATIARALGVRTVLQGSVRRSGNRVRVTAQLTSIADGYQLWSERFDQDLGDLFAMQDEIVRAIVGQLQLAFGLAPAAVPSTTRHTEELEAYQLFLRGREACHQRSAASFRRAIDFFRQALAIDPRYARAYAGLAEAFIGLGSYLYMPVAEARREAERALEEATRLEPELAIVHTLWGQLKLYLRPDWRDAGRDLDRALAIDPENPLAHTLLAILHGMQGNLELSRAAAARAVAADPLSPHVRAIAVAAFPHDGVPGCDATAALAAHEAALALDPNSVANLWMSALRLGDLGHFDEAIRRLVRAAQLTQDAPVIVGMRVRVLMQAGRGDEALALRDSLKARSAHEFIAAGVLLQGARLDSGGEAALQSLLEANIAEETGPVAILTTLLPELQPLLQHPSLGSLVRQLSPWSAQVN